MDCPDPRIAHLFVNDACGVRCYLQFRPCWRQWQSVQTLRSVCLIKNMRLITMLTKEYYERICAYKGGLAQRKTLRIKLSLLRWRQDYV